MHEKPTLKSERDRIEECMGIRQRLEMLGATLSERNREQLRAATNAFVKDGKGAMLKLWIDDEHSSRAVVSLQATEGRQSGITLEKQ